MASDAPGRPLPFPIPAQVLETCMKSCGKRFHDEVGKFRFLNELIKVVSPKVGAPSPNSDLPYQMWGEERGPSDCGATFPGSLLLGCHLSPLLELRHRTNTDPFSQSPHT